jgi:hypothetical protein
MTAFDKDFEDLPVEEAPKAAGGSFDKDFEDLPSGEKAKGNGAAYQPDFSDVGKPSLLERGKRFISDLPGRMARPRNDIPVTPPGDAMLAAAGGAPGIAPPVAGPFPAAEPQKPAGALTRAARMITVPDEMLASHAARPPGASISATPAPDVTGLDFDMPPVASISAARGRELSSNQRDKATDIMTLSRMTSLPPSFIQAHFDDLTKQMGIRGTPSLKELAGEMMKYAIAGGLATAPLKTALGVGTFMATKEAESIGVQAAKGEKPKLGQGREVKEFAGPLEGWADVAADVAEFVIPGAVAGGALKIPKLIADSTWYRKLTIPERSLVVQSVADLKKTGVSEGDIARMRPEEWKRMFKERGGTVEEEAASSPKPAPKSAKAPQAPPREAPPARSTFAPDFSDLSEQATEEGKPALRPAVLSDGEKYVGGVGETHDDVIGAHGLPEKDHPPTSPSRVFVDPDGNAMSRTEAVTWLDKNDPETAKTLREQDAGELHTEQYREAAGIEPTKETFTNVPPEVPSSAEIKQEAEAPPDRRVATRLERSGYQVPDLPTLRTDQEAIRESLKQRKADYAKALETAPQGTDTIRLREQIDAHRKSLSQLRKRGEQLLAEDSSALSAEPFLSLRDSLESSGAGRIGQTNYEIFQRGDGIFSLARTKDGVRVEIGSAMKGGGSGFSREKAIRRVLKEAALLDAPKSEVSTEEKKGILDSEEGFLDVSALTPGVEAALDVKAGVSSLLLPTAKSPEHLRAAEVLGSKLGSSHRDAEIASQSLAKDSRAFDKMGVNDPKSSLAENIGVKFMSDMSQGRTMTPDLQRVADKVRNLFDDRLRKLEQAGVELRTVRENYFPGMWKDKTQAVSFLSKRTLKGGESFRKQKVFDDIMEGIEAGLEPISNNPLDLVKLKLAEMGRSIMANRALREWEKAGDVKFLRIGQQMPEGFAKINDKYGTVWGPPVQTVSEHVDKAVYDGLMKVAGDMDLSPERKFSAGRSKLGYASPSGETVTQFATELSVLAHEIGHQIDFKHGLWDKIVAGAVDTGKRGKVTETASAKKRGKIQGELRALSDLTWEGSEPTDYYKQKVRKKPEKMAHMLEAYIHAPDRFKEVAPTVYADFDAFVKSHDELKGLSEIRQGLALEKISVEKPVGGIPIIGYRVARKPVAEILNNFLSSSIYNSPYFGTAFKAYMGTANLLNQSQLGVGSAFHAGFTSADVQISHNAEVIKDIYGVVRGNRTLGDLGRTIKKVPAAMITNPIRGAKVVGEWRTPTLEVPTNVPVGTLPTGNEAKIAMIAKAAELAGGAFHLEKGLRTEWTEKQIREWYGNQKVKAAMRTPVVLIELLAKPIMDYLVPRQKAGVFGELTGRIIETNPGKTMEQLAPQFRQAWNRVDARLGQVVYDRLFINNMAKNIIQGSIRAPGWTGGTIAEVITGAPKDFVNFFVEWKRTGKAPENIPDRVAYVLALLTTVFVANGLLTKAFTGDERNDIKGMDYWAFRTGGFDEKGRPERFILPTYAKDIFAWYQDWGHTLLAKTHPLLGIIADIKRNKDYYGVKIRNEDDPPIKQLADVSEYGFKAFEPFWIRGAGKEAERGGGWQKTLTESPQKLLAPQAGIMPAPQAYTMSAFEKYARKVSEERHPMGTRTKEEAEKGKMKQKMEQALRRGDPGAELDLEVSRAAGEITWQEARDIKRRSEEDPIEKVAKSMSLDDLARGIPKMNAKEKEIIQPIFKKKIHNATGKIDEDQKQKYLDLLLDLL